MMKLVFDLDGTLITCQNKHVQVMSLIVGSEFNEQSHDYWRNKREGLNNFESLLELGYEKNLALEISNMWVEKIETREALDYDELILTEKSINEIQQHDAYILTARKNLGLLEAQLKSLKIFDIFADVIVADPSRAIEEKAKHLANIRPDFFVGDSESDLKSAANAFVQFWPVSSGMRSEEFFINNFATKPFGNVNILINQLVKFNDKII